MVKNSKRLLLAALVVTSCLGACASGAWANRLSISERRFRAVWSSLEFSNASSTVRCPLTLEGSFHSSTLSKVERALIGHVSRASVGSCTGGTATVLAETLPWHVQYGGFDGTLPNITGLRLRSVGASFRVKPTGTIACLARTTETQPAKFRASVSGSTITELNALSEAEIPLTGEGGLCAFGGEGHLAGAATITVLGSTTRLSLTLPELGQRTEELEGGISYTLINDDNIQIEITEIRLGPPNPTRYSLELNTCRPFPVRLAVGASCNVNITRLLGGGSTEIETETTIGRWRRNVS